MAKTKSVSLVLNGKPTTFKIKTELAWGEVIELLRVFGLGGDTQNVDSVIEGLHALLKHGVEDSPIDIEDRTALFQLSGGEVTTLIGEVMKTLPLQTYLKNLGFMDDPKDLLNVKPTKAKK